MNHEQAQELIGLLRQILEALGRIEKIVEKEFDWRHHLYQLDPASGNVVRVD